MLQAASIRKERPTQSHLGSQSDTGSILIRGGVDRLLETKDQFKVADPVDETEKALKSSVPDAGRWGTRNKWEVQRTADK